MITAYSITSAYTTDDVCVTISGEPVTLTAPYTITKPAGVDAQDFLPREGSSFLDFLGFPNCVGGGQSILPTQIVSEGVNDGTGVLTTQTALPPSALITQTVLSARESPILSAVPSISLNTSGRSVTLPSQISGQSNNPTHLGEQAKIGIGCAVSITLLLAVAITSIMIYRKRKDKKSSVSDVVEMPKGRGSHQPYLQQKSELEAEARQRHELPADERIFELAGERNVHEIPAKSNDQKTTIPEKRQELRGVEHSQEMEVPRV